MKFAPTRNLPDDTPVIDIHLPTRISNGLLDLGLRTVGEIRETSDGNLLSAPNLGPSSLRWLRDHF